MIAEHLGTQQNDVRDCQALNLQTSAFRTAATADTARIRSASASAASRSSRACVDETGAKRDLLRAADLESLARLDGLDEHRGAQQRFVRAGVEPGDAAAQHLHAQRLALEICAIDVGDLELAARRRLDAGRDVRRRRCRRSRDRSRRSSTSAASASPRCRARRRRCRNARRRNAPGSLHVIGEDGRAVGTLARRCAAVRADRARRRCCRRAPARRHCRR